MQTTQTQAEEIEQAMYIQIDSDEAETRRQIKKMKLVKQKPDQTSKSPRPRKIASNEGAISDVSDVEPNPQTGNQMLKLHLGFDNLADILERFQNQLIQNGSDVRDLQAALLGKVGQRQLSTFLERISLGVSKEVGEKQHRYKLDEQAFLEGDNNPEARIPKQAVEGFFDKLDIISQAIIKIKKNQAQMMPRLTKLEDA